MWVQWGGPYGKDSYLIDVMNVVRDEAYRLFRSGSACSHAGVVTQDEACGFALHTRDCLLLQASDAFEQFCAIRRWRGKQAVHEKDDAQHGEGHSAKDYQGQHRGVSTSRQRRVQRRDT